MIQRKLWMNKRLLILLLKIIKFKGKRRMIWSCNSSIFLGRFSLASWRSLMLWFTSSYWCFCWMNFHNLITKENKLFFQNFFAVLIGHETYESKSFAFSRVWILNYMCVKDGSVFGKSFSELFISNLTWNSTDKELLSLFIEFSDQCGLWINELSINEMVLMMENLLHRFLTSKCYKTESTRYKGIFDFSKGRKVLQKRFYGWWKEKSESRSKKSYAALTEWRFCMQASNKELSFFFCWFRRVGTRLMINLSDRGRHDAFNLKESKEGD